MSFASPLRLAALAAPLGLALLLACPGTPDPDAGTGDDAGNADAGATDGGQDVDAGPGGRELGTACAFGGDQCGEGRVCTSIFANPAQPNQVDEASATCYAACETQGTPCTAAFGQPGTCAQVPARDGTALACVAQSPNLGPCGNGANASCAVNLCALPPDSLVGFCVTPCVPDGDDCPDPQECSTSPLRLDIGGGQTRGVCSDPSAPGDPCGIDAAAGVVRVCTGDQTCAETEQGPRCQAPDTDAGP